MSGDYEKREIAIARRQAQEVNAAPLVDRQAARDDFFEAMRDTPQIVGERVGWLLGGNYGFGPKWLAERVVFSRSRSKVAALTQMVGVFEWQSPERMTVQAWKRLTIDKKHNLARAVEEEIDEALKRAGF